jgi:hypothetical protein
MSTVHVVLESPLSPERVLAAARDFSERRADIFPAVSLKRLTVHALGDKWADVTEGTRAGPVVNWERCRYDWSTPGSVTAPLLGRGVVRETDVEVWTRRSLSTCLLVQIVAAPSVDSEQLDCDLIGPIPPELACLAAAAPSDDRTQ